MAKIAFDIDDTLYKVEYERRIYSNGIDEMLPVRQVPDYDLFNLLLTLHKLGNSLFLWSGGGLEYSMNFADKFGIRGLVQCIEKSKESANAYNIDITFDDEEITLGKVNIRIPREKYGE